MYRLAEHLGKTVAEVLEMTESEYQGWLAYFDWKLQESKKYSKG